MPRKKLKRSRSQKQAKELQQEKEAEELLQSPKVGEEMVEEEQSFEPALQEQHTEDQPSEPAKKFKRSRSQKEGRDLHLVKEVEQLHHSPNMEEEEQLSEPAEQDQHTEDQPSEPAQQDLQTEDQVPLSMEGDPPSQNPKDQTLKDQDSALLEEKVVTNQIPQLVLVEEEPPNPTLVEGKEEEDQNPTLVEEKGIEDQNPKLVFAAEEPQNTTLVEKETQVNEKEEDQNPKLVLLDDEPQNSTLAEEKKEDQNPEVVFVKGKEDEDVNPKLVLVEEEPPPQDRRHDEDGNHDLESQPQGTEAPDEIHDLENQSEEDTAHPEVEKVDEEELLQQLQPYHEQEQDPEGDEQQHLYQDEENEPVPEPEGMTLSPTLPPPPVREIALHDILPDNSLHNAPNVSRKGPKRKKPLNQRQRAALEKKLQAVKENLQPIPFIPSKTLDFSKHEKSLKRLGLWDFAHLEFDREIRRDLLVQLIASFNPQLRCSYVNDLRVMVNRADLGRALKLPSKKDKSSQESGDSDVEKLPEDFIAFMEDFVPTWFFPHEDEDTWILPDEIVALSKLIRDGHPEKIDWPGLMWFMVEKELTQSASLGSCYYASHLQCLIKAQQPELLKEEPAIDAYMKEEEDADIKETSAEDFQREEMESGQIELSLGHVNIDCEHVRDKDDDMDFQDCKDDEPGLWRLDGRNSVGESFLQRCNLNEVGGVESEHERKEVVEEEQYDLSSKHISLERLSSTELIQAMGTANISFNTPSHLFSHSSGELLTSRVEDHMNVVGPSAYVNGCKRDLELDDDVNHHSFNDQHKRMRSDGSWDQKELDFNLCMEQVQSWMGKARLMYEAKEQGMMNSHLHQQALISELQQQNKIIESLHRSKSEEDHKRRLEIYRLEHELCVMSNLLDGYKQALRETRKAFSEYRQCHPQPEEPLYMDVPGSGGLVLSTMELEKRRKEKEEDLRVKRSMIEEEVKNCEQKWLGILDFHLMSVHSLGSRLLDLENVTKLLKESFVKREVLET